MEVPLSDSQRTAPMTRGEKILYFLDLEARILAEHLDELPAALVAIAAEEDVNRLRSAIVAVCEAVADFRALQWRLHCAIARLEALDNLQPDDPSGCVPTGTDGTAMLPRSDGSTPESA